MDWTELETKLGHTIIRELYLNSFLIDVRPFIFTIDASETQYK